MYDLTITHPGGGIDAVEVTADRDSSTQLRKDSDAIGTLPDLSRLADNHIIGLPRIM
jgi:hypothetical protein